MNTDQLLQNREIMAVYSENQSKHINALAWQNSEFLAVKPDGT
jgi:hypothetical protein